MRTFGPKGHLLDPVNRGGSDYRGGKYSRAVVGGQRKSLSQKQYRRCLVVDDHGDEGKEGKEGYAAKSRKRLSRNMFKFLSMTQRYAMPDSLPLESNHGTGALPLSPNSMPPSGVRRRRLTPCRPWRRSTTPRRRRPVSHHSPFATEGFRGRRRIRPCPVESALAAGLTTRGSTSSPRPRTRL